MLDFGQSKAQSGLEPWPSLQESGATVHEGDPRQAGRVDFGSFETVMMSGVWECTQGKFSLTYPWNEFATILEGSVTITDSSGTSMTFGPGDSHYAEKGEWATWHITTPKVRKCFFLCKDDQAEASG